MSSPSQGFSIYISADATVVRNVSRPSKESNTRYSAVYGTLLQRYMTQVMYPWYNFSGV